MVTKERRCVSREAGAQRNTHLKSIVLPSESFYSFFLRGCI